MGKIEKISILNLQIFNNLMNLGSFSRVSEELGIPVEKVCYEIKTLERLAGQKLFHKHRNKIVLNEYGKKIAAISSSIEEPLKVVTSHLQNPVIKEDIKLSISTTYGIAEIYFPRIIKEFISKHQNVDVEIRTGRAFLDFSDPNTDIVIGPVLTNRSDLSEALLHNYKYYLYAHKDYVINSTPIRELKDLNGHRFLKYTGSDFNFSEFPDIKIIARSDSYKLIVELASLGLGLCCLPDVGFLHYVDKKEEIIKVQGLPHLGEEKIFFMYKKFSTKFQYLEDLLYITKKVLKEGE